MKKLLIILTLLTLNGGFAFANCDNFICPSNPYLSNGFVRGLGSVTGTNLLAEKTAQSILKSQIKKEAQGDFDVKLKSFSLSDLKAGRFKSLEITGKNVIAEDIYLSMLKLKTLCDYNYIVIDEKKKTTTFKEDFGMAFAATITEEDLNNTMRANGYQKLIDEINSMGKSTKLFKITTSHAKLRNNQLLYIVQVAFPLMNTKQKIVISSDININNGKLFLSHTKVLNDYFKADLSKISYLINYLNPLNFTLSILENKDATLTVREAAIKNNKIDIDGTIIVLKDVVTENKE